MDIDMRFGRYVQEHKLFTKNDKLLVAVSGGKDSMLLLTLLFRYGAQMEAAHCNFGLRGEESDGDERLVCEYCGQLGVKLHVRRFDTQSYAESHKISIQMAARELRYQWFEELRIERGCNYVAIAQHKNDHIETVLLNLARGTGLLGLQGILPKREALLRPLLFLGSEEVSQSVKQLGVAYRDDSSNSSNKYARNKIRLDIVPEFEALNRDFVQVMEDNITRFQDAQRVLQYFVGQKRDELFVPSGRTGWEIRKEAVIGLDMGLLYFLFEPFGFSKAVLRDLLSAMQSEPGKIFMSATHQLLLDRTVLRLRKIGDLECIVRLYKGDKSLRWRDYTFTVDCLDKVEIEKDRAVALLDYDKLVFPLTVRTWQEGDSFQPLGMRGRKKVSDFFIQKKISVFEKKEIPIWWNGNGELLWITNHQMDERYKITENTQKVLKLVCNIS